MTGDARSAAIVESTVPLARFGCDEGQGYHLGRPLPADDLLVWLVAVPAR
jgi:EAL domain-containing protein (putative c-di-GMP-specific phosphodiesterase class I)